MKSKLTGKETIFLASMLFGMFFGAGNLIFPVSMGQLAGANLWPAIVGFCLTGVGLPLLGIAAMGLSRSEGLFEMCKKVGRPYAYFFTCLLYLCIGPLFAIPRTATVAFSVGIQPLTHSGNSSRMLLIFSVLFFAVTLLFSLWPGKIMTWIGKVLNPLFLIFLGILIVAALLHPMGELSAGVSIGNYVDMSFFQGFLEGYHTLDALASLAFGIIMINAIRDLGVKEPAAISSNTLRSGILSILLMAAIYCLLTLVGAQSVGTIGISADGGQALYLIGTHYFGPFGGVLLGIVVTIACLKTAIGLVTACGEAFRELFPKSMNYRVYAALFCVISLVIANFGLNRIIELSLPVLMFLYPLTITMIFLCLFGQWFHYDRRVFVSVTVCTAVPAFLDLLNNLPKAAREILHVGGILQTAENNLPLFKIGMGWVGPAAVGLVIGLILYFFGRRGAK